MVFVFLCNLILPHFFSTSISAGMLSIPYIMAIWVAWTNWWADSNLHHIPHLNELTLICHLEAYPTLLSPCFSASTHFCAHCPAPSPGAQGGSRYPLGLAQCFGGSVNDASLGYTMETWALDGKVPEGYPVLPDYTQSSVLSCMAELKTTLEQAAQWVPQREASLRTTQGQVRTTWEYWDAKELGVIPSVDTWRFSSVPSVDIWCMWELCTAVWCRGFVVMVQFSESLGYKQRHSRRKSHLYDQRWS